PESPGPLELLGGVEQQLHAEADPEQRGAAACALADQLDQPQLAEVAHRQRKRADAGEHQALAGPQLVGVGGDRRAGAGLLQRLLDRAAVAHPVVDHADPRGAWGVGRAHTSVPFVLGTPRSVGSSATAARSARAAALNAASIKWWTFE